MLEQILVNIEKLRDQGKSCLVVFDLDSTLFDVSPRLERILIDFAAMPVNQLRFPNETKKLESIKTLRSDWGIRGALERAGIENANAEFLTAIKNYWINSFFSNHYLQFDSVYEGALEFVAAIEQAGAEIAYLTGRDVERMGEGSLDVLKQWGFPIHEKANLVLKPKKGMDDAQFKTDWFIEADKKGFEKIYFFENEPVNLQHLMQFCPHVEMIFFESTHAGKAEPPSNIPRIENFLFSRRES